MTRTTLVDIVSESNAWFDPNTFGALFGGLGGGLGGAVLGIIGACAAYFAKQGRYRTFTLGVLEIYILGSAFLLLIGGIAVVVGQPFGIWMPMLFLGVHFLVLSLFSLKMAKRMYALASNPQKSFKPL